MRNQEMEALIGNDFPATLVCTGVEDFLPLQKNAVLLHRNPDRKKEGGLGSSA